jgi:CRISPR/Cas system CSM-associated protein Csm3 (group 7 of RAMP superfamily)
LRQALGVSDLLPDKRRFFTLHATFALQGSLLIRAGEGQDDIGPDMVHLHARQPNGKRAPIVSGTSLAGALRARATRIANTLDKAGKARELIYDIFGPDMNDREWMKAKKEKGVRASRLTVKERVVANGRTDLVQNRVSIDRFTGGARDTALFNEQPVFATNETIVTVDLHLRNPKEADVGLLLLLLNDLWTEDLPLGGESSVGRGRLQGRRAKLTYKNGAVEEWVMTAVSPATPNQLTFEKGNPTRLQEFVDELHKHLTGEQP